MKLTIQIPDDLYDAIKKQAKGTYPKDVEAEVLHRLTLLKDVPHTDRFILLFGAERKALEAVFQTTVDDASDLVRKVHHMGLFRFGEVEFPLTPEELAFLGEQARFFGLDPHEHITRTGRQVLDQLTGCA
jgi:hypothetical protein